jgi:hypothetical protein
VYYLLITENSANLSGSSFKPYNLFLSGSCLSGVTCMKMSGGQGNEDDDDVDVLAACKNTSTSS